MMRDRRLFERQGTREVANADLIISPRQRSEHRKAVGIPKRFKKARLLGAIGMIDDRRRATTLY